MSNALPGFVPNRGPIAATKLRALLPVIDQQIRNHEAALASLDASFAKGLEAMDEQAALRGRLDTLARQNRKKR